MGQKHYSKTAKRKAKKVRGNPLDLPEVQEIPKRQRNGQKRRAVEDRGVDKVALKARCRQRGVASTADNIRDSRAPWWGCSAGRAMAKATENHADRVKLWDAIQHMRRVVTAYDAAIGAPSRHAVCLSLLVPLEKLEATADTPALDERTPEERHRQAVAAYMRLEGWLGWTDKAAVSEVRRVVLDDATVRDRAGFMSALLCVADGMIGRRLTYRGRDSKPG